MRKSNSAKKAILALPAWISTTSAAKLTETDLLSCSLCGSPAIVSSRLRKVLPNAPVICWSCALGRIDPKGVEVALHRVVREELDEIGIPENIVNLLLEQITKSIRRGLH